MQFSRAVRRRFWVKVERTPTCWLWEANTFPGGYGQFKLNGTPTGAHRVAWMFARGPIPSGMCVCHRCDNPCCVRLSHLFLGTSADNNADTRNKGRHRFGIADTRGELNGRARLCTRDVRRIRRLRQRGNTLAVISRRFKISIAHVGRIARNEAWNH